MTLLLLLLLPTASGPASTLWQEEVIREAVNTPGVVHEVGGQGVAAVVVAHPAPRPAVLLRVFPAPEGGVTLLELVTGPQAPGLLSAGAAVIPRPAPVTLVPTLARPPHRPVHRRLLAVPVEVGVQRLEVVLGDVGPDELPIARPDKPAVLAGLVVQPMIVDGVVITVQEVATGVRSVGQTLVAVLQPRLGAHHHVVLVQPSRAQTLVTAAAHAHSILPAHGPLDAVIRQASHTRAQGPRVIGTALVLNIRVVVSIARGPGVASRLGLGIGSDLPRPPVHRGLLHRVMEVPALHQVTSDH